MSHPQEKAKWSVGKNGNCVVSNIPDGIYVEGAIDPDPQDYYGGVLVGESIQKEVAEMIVRDHEIVKQLTTLTETDRDNLCDIIWWFRGYKKGADNSFNDCPFHQDHLDTLEKTTTVLREIFNQKK